MRDRDVREALCRKVLAEHVKDPGTLVVQELGLVHGGARVDIAVVNGRFHGFEIKSDVDTLLRLPTQIEAYNGVFDRVTIVAGSKHITKVVSLVPTWWGVKAASSGKRGAVHFDEIRFPRQNPSIDALSLAGLLWHEESVNALMAIGLQGVKSKTRVQLARLLAETLTLSELRELVRQSLKVRASWRSDAQQIPNGGL